MNSEKYSVNESAALQLVTFRLGKEHYGIPVGKVKEIIRPMNAFPVPGMSGAVDGVINLRGEIIPVLRIHSILGVPEIQGADGGRKKRIIILDTGEGGFGFVVDEVMDVVRVSSAEVKKSPEVSGDRSCEEALLGIVQIGDNIIICINPARLVTECLNVKEAIQETVDAN